MIGVDDFDGIASRQNGLDKFMPCLEHFATETEPLNITAPIDISNCVDPNLKFVTSVLFEQTFQ